MQKIEEARRILELDEEATLEEINSAYRRLSLLYHPDRCVEKDKKICEQKFKQINSAYDCIKTYCSGYKYSFKKKDVRENDPEQEYREHMARFYGDWF